MNDSIAAAEIRDGARFGFGANWARFLKTLDDQRIRSAEDSLRDWLETDGLAGRSFLDVGSGSGLFSLAARRLGARVHSFDYDPQSVACTAELRRRYLRDDRLWTVEQGSALDEQYLSRLGLFDVVYSWGVLHHTGDLWRAVDLVQQRVADGGLLFLALYNDQGRMSRVWLHVKQLYNRLPRGLRFLALWPSFAYLWGPATILDLLRGRPFKSWRDYGRTNRGMSPWRDVVDWVGGYPFEVAKPEEVFDHLRARGFELRRLQTWAGGHGCNQYVFQRMANSS